MPVNVLEYEIAISHEVGVSAHWFELPRIPEEEDGQAERPELDHELGELTRGVDPQRE